MPNHIRAILSGLVTLVAIIVFFFEFQAAGGFLAWFVLALGGLMVGAIWLFPEIKGVNDD